MAGEKTEKATPKKRRDARKEGNVLKSNEVNSWVGISAGILSFSLLWRGMLDQLVLFFTSFFSDEYNLFYAKPEPEVITEIFILSSVVLLKTCAPIMSTVMAAASFSNFIQAGVLFIPKNLMPKFERISMLKGFKRIFSMQGVRELIKSLLKTAVISVIGYQSIVGLYDTVYVTLDTDVETALEYTVKLFTGLAFKLIIALLVVVLVDYIMKWFEHEKKLKMSKQEIKDEYKTTEGNPEIKAKVREIQRTMASMRMMAQVPLSDVVITNPTHYAVAIRYDSKKDNAPTVTAKGKDILAEKIKKTAKENKISIVENRDVAQALYKTTDIGKEIPVDLFNAVAEILAYIYKLKGKKNI